MKHWKNALHFAPAWLALALILFTTLSIAVRSFGDLESLSGPWTAELNGEAVTLHYPGRLGPQGIDDGQRVVARKEVVVPSDQPMALWVDTPCCALQARWDGAVAGQVGTLGSNSPSARSNNSLLVLLPPAAAGSKHLLELELEGSFGRGGITGDLLFGPAVDIVDAASSQETQRLSLALGLSLLAFLPLTVAAGRRTAGPYLFYGLFASSLALLSFGQSNVAGEMMGGAEALLRLQRLAEGVLAPMLLAFLGNFVYGRTTFAQRVALAIGGVLSMTALVIPGSALYLLEVVQDSTVVLGVPWVLFLLVEGVRRKVPGAWLMMGLTAFPVVIGAGLEISLTHGMRTGSSHLYEASLLLVGGTGASLMLRDALASARHERLVSSSVDAMVVVSQSGRISDANPAAKRCFGPCLDRNILEFVDPEDHPVVRAHIERSRRDADRVEFRLGSSKDAMFESLATPLGGGVTLLVLRDITTRKQIDRGLIQAARLETVGVLLGGIAHDFNNMLGTQLAHLGWLQMRVDDELAQERMSRMEGTIDRASQLTRRLLTIARGSAAELGPVDLASVCRHAVELVEPTLGSDIGLELDLPPHLPPVHGDGSELEQVLVNLLVNARDAMADGGRVRLAVRQFQLEDGARGVCAMVEDNGPGVPEELRDEIFQPFITTKGWGTGLGLAVASQVVRDHHGRIWYEPRPGGGSRFVIALRHADAVDQAPAPMPQNRSVLVVEDERVLLEDYANALRAAGYDVTAMSDPAQAASWLLGRRPDILVTDVVMDGLSGVELATLCSHRYPEVPVLLVSGFIPNDTLPFSTWHRLHKPVRSARLVSTVGSLRRRAERAERGEMDITRVSYLFPTLQELSAEGVGFT